MIGENTITTTDVGEKPSELNTAVDEISEPQPKRPKEEQIEYDISHGSEQQNGLGEADILNTPDCVKNEEDSKMPTVTDSFIIKVVEWNPDSSATLSAEDVNNEQTDSDSLTDFSQLSRSEESTDESQAPRKHKSKKKASLFRCP